LAAAALPASVRHDRSCDRGRTPASSGRFRLQYSFSESANEQARDHRQCPAGCDRDQLRIPGDVWCAYGARPIRLDANSTSLPRSSKSLENARSLFTRVLSEMGAGDICKRSEGCSIRFRTYARRVSETAGSVRPGGPQYRNVAQAVAPCPGALWLVACGLLS